MSRYALGYSSTLYLSIIFLIQPFQRIFQRNRLCTFCYLLFDFINCLIYFVALYQALVELRTHYNQVAISFFRDIDRLLLLCASSDNSLVFLKFLIGIIVGIDYTSLSDDIIVSSLRVVVNHSNFISAIFYKFQKTR